MKYYFSLQYRLISRQLADNGLHPLLLAAIIALGFTLLSQYIIMKASYMSYLYALIPSVLCFTLQGYERNSFLKHTFSNKDYYLIRLSENALIGLPFAILLLVNGSWLPALLLFVVNSFLLLVSENRKFNLVLPTPFYKYPFEFLVGFRKTILLLLALYLICGIAITVDNFNLAVFSLIIIHLSCLFYYSDPEDPYYVWIYSKKSSDFILSKIKTMLFYSTLLSFPVLMALIVAFPDQALLVLLIQLMGYISISASLLSKYAYFPHRISLAESILFMVSLILIPLVILFIPYFYTKSQKSLNKLLK